MIRMPEGPPPTDVSPDELERIADDAGVGVSAVGAYYYAVVRVPLLAQPEIYRARATA